MHPAVRHAAGASVAGMFDHRVRIIVVGAALLALAVGAAGCGGAGADARSTAPDRDAAVESIVTVDVDEAAAAADRGDVLLVDVREQAEWDAGHAADAIHVPLAEVESRLQEITAAATDRPVWFICRSGNRSEQAARTARAGGLDDVASVDGGMGAWVEAGHPIVPRDGVVA